MAATFTLDDVRKHNSKDDVWMVIHNKGGSLLSHTK